MEVNMKTEMKIQPSFSRKVQPPRDLLTPEELKGCKSISEGIRLCLTKHPGVKDREVSDFLGLNRPQWVWNVRHQILKRVTK